MVDIDHIDLLAREADWRVSVVDYDYGGSCENMCELLLGVHRHLSNIGRRSMTVSKFTIPN